MDIENLNLWNCIGETEGKDGWCYVEYFTEIPTTRGYLNKSYLSYDFKKYSPSQGICNHANFYRNSNVYSDVLSTDNSSHLFIKKREKEWALCDAMGGVQDV